MDMLATRPTTRLLHRHRTSPPHPPTRHAPPCTRPAAPSTDKLIQDANPKAWYPPCLRCTWAGDSRLHTSASGPNRKVESRKPVAVYTTGRHRNGPLVQHMSSWAVDWLSKAVEEILQAWRTTGVTSSAGSTVSTVLAPKRNSNSTSPIQMPPAAIHFVLAPLPTLSMWHRSHPPYLRFTAAASLAGA